MQQRCCPAPTTSRPGRACTSQILIRRHLARAKGPDQHLARSADLPGSRYLRIRIAALCCFSCFNTRSSRCVGPAAHWFRLQASRSEGKSSPTSEALCRPTQAPQPDSRCAPLLPLTQTPQAANKRRCSGPHRPHCACQILVFIFEKGNGFASFM